MDPTAFGRIPAPALISAPRGGSPQQPEPGSFGKLLGEAVARVQQVQAEAEKELQKLLAGEPVELHRVMLASERAGLASELMMAVRNKVVDAYQEIMRTQV